MTHSTETPADHYRRLAWQCRRGIKEVEVVLVPFFEQHFMALSLADQALFENGASVCVSGVASNEGTREPGAAEAVSGQ